MTVTVWNILNWHAPAPSDLSEIDAQWAKAVVGEHISQYPQVFDVFMNTSDEEWKGHAEDLRDNMHTAVCDLMQWERDEVPDYLYD